MEVVANYGLTKWHGVDLLLATWIILSLELWIYFSSNKYRFRQKY